MSKKKASSGSTMTLKDFHGGSIPSDIPLPSAPGVIAKPTDRPGSGFDRQGSWGNPMGRPDQRLRPSSSGSLRNFDDKTPFLTNTVHIGRNFDEDERKPLDGSSGPRRTINDDAIGAPPMRMEPRSDAGRFMGTQISAPLSPVYSARATEAIHMGSATRNSAAGNGVSNGQHPNAWGIRKEVETTPSPYVGQSSVAKFAQASALDKVSSGRWQSKPVHHQTDVEIIRQVESPNSLRHRRSDGYHGINSMNEREEAPIGERIRSPVLLDAKETSERPKLKLLPRSRPLDATELPPAEYKEKFQQASDSTHMDFSHETVVNDTVKSGMTAGIEDGKQLPERPKLNLKPRSQPVEQPEETAERVRLALFGGARPREQVLKARGADDLGNSQELIQSPVRVKKDSPPAETVLVHSNAMRTSGRLENANLDHRTSKNSDRREQRTDSEKTTDPQRKNWRNENWRNPRDNTEKQQQNQAQHQQERPPSPETWRKPVEESKPANCDGSGLRFGKAVSAVELAQAFSKSVSDPKQNVGQFSSPKGIPARTQVPFSRLTGSTSRPQLNGY